jgi:hypothetical protein
MKISYTTYVVKTLELKKNTKNKNSTPSLGKKEF